MRHLKICSGCFALLMIICGVLIVLQDYFSINEKNLSIVFGIYLCAIIPFVLILAFVVYGNQTSAFLAEPIFKKKKQR